MIIYELILVYPIYIYIVYISYRSIADSIPIYMIYIYTHKRVFESGDFEIFMLVCFVGYSEYVLTLH